MTVVVKTKGADTAAKDLKNIGDAAEKSHGPISRMGSALGDVGKIAGGFVLAQGILKAPGFLMDAAKAAAEDEQSVARLSATIKTLGGDFDAQNAKVQEAIKHGQDLAFTDDEVRDSFDKLAQATGSTEEALARQALAMDLARGANIPLADASKLLGKVTDENLQVFKRMGITLTDVSTEADVLAAVQGKFAGQSEAYAKSTAGQFEQTKIRMGELKESIGAELLPVMAKLGDVLLTEVIPKLEQFAAAAGPKIRQFIDDVKPALAEFAEQAKVQFAKFQGYYESDLKPAFDNIVTAIKFVVAQIKEHWDKIGPIVEAVGTIIKTHVDFVVNVLQIVIDLLGGDFTGAWKNAKEAVGNIIEGFRAFITILKNIAEAIMDGMLEGLNAGAAYVWEWLKDIGPAVLRFIGNVSNLLWDAGKAIAASLLAGLVAGAKAVWDEVSGWGNRIRSLKGPMSVDEVLLFTEGEAIAMSLKDGLSSGFERDVVSEIKGWAPKIKSLVGGAVAAMAGGGGSGSGALDGVPEYAASIAGAHSGANLAGVPGMDWSFDTAGGTGWGLQPADRFIDSRERPYAAGGRLSAMDVGGGGGGGAQTINLVVDGAVLASVVNAQNGLAY